MEDPLKGLPGGSVGGAARGPGVVKRRGVPMEADHDRTWKPAQEGLQVSGIGVAKQ